MIWLIGYLVIGLIALGYMAYRYKKDTQEMEKELMTFAVFLTILGWPIVFVGEAILQRNLNKTVRTQAELLEQEKMADMDDEEKANYIMMRDIFKKKP
jgi:hypothetical protein